MGFSCVNGQMEHAEWQLGEIVECFNEYKGNTEQVFFIDAKGRIYKSIHLGNYKFRLRRC